MIWPIFFLIYFTDLFCNAEQVYKNVHIFFETKGRPWNQFWTHRSCKQFWRTRENILFFRRVHDAGVCHGPVPVVKKTIFLRIDIYLLIGSCFCSIYSLRSNIIISVVIFDVLHLDVAESWKWNFTDLPTMW